MNGYTLTVERGEALDPGSVYSMFDQWIIIYSSITKLDYLVKLVHTTCTGITNPPAHLKEFWRELNGLDPDGSEDSSMQFSILDPHGNIRLLGVTIPHSRIKIGFYFQFYRAVFKVDYPQTDTIKSMDVRAVKI
jgi:hypothetical protein